MKVILASNSPRRRELLALTGMDFEVVPADVDESPFPGEHPADYVLRLAVEKAGYVHKRQRTDHLVIAADTTVADGDLILGKPANEVEADSMLRQLRGRTHQVFSGIALTLKGEMITECCETDVPLRSYSDDEIQAYFDSGDPLDKAGAYAIQNASFNPVEEFQGCFANVMGLPLCHLVKALRKYAIDLDVDISKACQDALGYTCPVFHLILNLTGNHKGHAITV